jgi:hypothetical protein
MRWVLNHTYRIVRRRVMRVAWMCYFRLGFELHHGCSPTSLVAGSSSGDFSRLTCSCWQPSHGSASTLVLRLARAVALNPPWLDLERGLVDPEHERR